MSAQERETKKNFIAILSEAACEQHAAHLSAKSDRPIRRRLLGLMAAVLNRDSNTRGLSN